jgi:putative sterol carrier protein
MTNIKPYLQKIVNRFSNPDVQSALKGFSRSIQFRFTDTNEAWLMKTFDGRQATFTQSVIAKPDVLITTTTDILAGILDKKMNGAAAYMQRKLRVKGAMEDLLKLQKLLM